MNPVEIIPMNGALFLRARGSELLILNQHVARLKGLTGSKEFANYFLTEALVNRPARKLFEAWLRKDSGLWRRIYVTIHKEMEEVSPADGEQEAKPAQEQGPALSEAPEKALLLREEVPTKTQPIAKEGGEEPASGPMAKAQAAPKKSINKASEEADGSLTTDEDSAPSSKKKRTKKSAPPEEGQVEAVEAKKSSTKKKRVTAEGGSDH